MKPFISVIIPNFNRQLLIQRAIESVNQQHYPNLEIIIVDDKSTDQSVSIIRDLQKQQDNLSLFVVEENSGANACRSIGVEKARGEYIAFLDSDDYFLPTKLEKQVRILQDRPEVGFVVTGFGAKAVHPLSEGIIPLKETIKQNNLGGFSTLMVRKELFQQVGGLDSNLLSCQDWDLFLKLLQVSQGYKLAEDLVAYEVQEDSISKNATKVIQGYQIVSQRARAINQTLQVLPEKDLQAYQEYYLAMRYFKLGQIKETRQQLWKSLQIKPRFVPFLYWTCSLFGYSTLKKLLQVKQSFISK
ncbi:glycosyltransferase family 2 protein [Streptococcus suis]|uniref:glycosyltransferase family 2 protein n=1 Tax=Streptococcus suis TaxID=1307 RepID=UPI00211856FD|nr:glycosyltransferase family 2 protein [Streptococcus suis]